MATVFDFPYCGHAPSRIRYAFLEMVDRWLALGELGESYFSKVLEEGVRPIRLIRRLYNCTDILPAEYCLRLGIRQHSTYAQAARRIEQFILGTPTGEPTAA